jgi:nitrogen fixation/metabolism regulation signal transduction histidine kinase
MVAMSTDLDPATLSAIESDAKAEDAKVLVGIALGIFILAICLAVTGILVTHKVVGPAYKMQLLFKGLQRGRLRVNGSLRKGDELQEVFTAFEAMVSTLRSKQADEIRCLDDAIAAAQQDGVPEDNLRVFRELRGRMQAELD